MTRKLLGIMAALLVVVALVAVTAAPVSASTAIEYGLIAADAGGY